MSTEDTVHNAADELRARVADLQRDIEALGKAAKSAAHEKLDEVRHDAEALYGQGRAKAERLEKSVEAAIAERPVTALLAAAGVGFVLGALWMRR